MATSILTPLSSILTVTDTPTLGHMIAWWETMWADPTDLQTAFADGFPRELDDFLALLRDTERPFWMCLKDREPLGAFWLHDLLYDETGDLCGGWIGGHIIQAARRPYGWALSEVTLKTLRTAGLAHVFAAVNVHNRRSQAYVRRGLRFIRVTDYKNFTLFSGQVTDVVIYSWRRDDYQLALAEARKRATRNMASWYEIAMAERS
jgi:hypothetical protein